MKVVINRRHGGFGLSEKAMYLYAERKGLTLTPRGGGIITTYWTCPPDQIPKEWKNLANEWLSMSPEQREKVNRFYAENTLSDRRLDRADLDLIAVVEELGEEANGQFAQLEIEDLPAGTLYRIVEYDGLESIETEDDVDWKVAF